MKDNGPVTGKEIVLPDGCVIVSETDDKGRMLDANAAFYEVSGYTPEECLGQPHNLLRHPDMPKEAFADLWRTLKSGSPWEGIVKNRAKNGDHYWVIANVTPSRGPDGAVRYVSIRQAAPRAMVEACERIYPLFLGLRKKWLMVSPLATYSRQGVLADGTPKAAIALLLITSNP